MVLYADPGAGASSGEAAGAAKFQSLSTVGTGGGGQVYMGMTAPPGANLTAQARANVIRSYMAEGDFANARAFQQSPQPNWVSEKQAEDAFYSWNDKTMGDFISKAAVAGLLKRGDGPLEAAGLWKKLVKEASIYGSQGRQVSPGDLLMQYVNGAQLAGPTSRTTTQTRVDLTDPATVKAMATSVFQSMLGRDPNPGELAQFGGALTAAEQANPLSQTTTTQYDAQGNPTGSNTQSTGGMTDQGRQYLAQQEVKAKPELGAVQAATTYMNALESAIYGAHG